MMIFIAILYRSALPVFPKVIGYFRCILWRDIMETVGSGVEKMVFVVFHPTYYLAIGPKGNITNAVIGDVAAIASLGFKGVKLVAIKTA